MTLPSSFRDKRRLMTQATKFAICSRDKCRLMTCEKVCYLFQGQTSFDDAGDKVRDLFVYKFRDGQEELVGRYNASTDDIQWFVSLTTLFPG